MVANSAGCVDGFRPRIGTHHAETLTEPPRRFHAERVVTAGAAVLHHLDIAETGERQPRCSAADRAGNGLVDILEALQVTAQPAQVAHLERPVGGQLPLDI